MAGIFINYRRDDAPGVAGRLYDHLAKSFPRRDLFMDVDAIKPGLDFVKQLDAQVSKCDVLLAVIGPDWPNAQDANGRRRLDGDKDYVRIEIASALKRDIPVIPVLVHGAVMPAEDDLPEDLKPLTRRQALELRHTRFNADADAIGSALKDCLPHPKKRWVWPLVAAVACIVGAVGLWSALSPYFLRSTAPPVAPAPTAELPKKPAAEVGASQPAAPQPTIDELKRKADEGPAAVAKPIEGFRVALGDPFDRVKGVYPNAATVGTDASKPPDLNLPLDGIRFFFTAARTLDNIRVDSPFKGSVQGVRIGDSLDDVLRRLGQPYSAPWDFAGNKAYAYQIGETMVRYDIDKSNKVATIFQFVHSSSPDAASTPTPDVNPGPRIDKLSVALGDSFDRVRAAYPTAGDSGSGELNMPLDGIRLFFTKEDKVLQEIMLEAPFTGSINGVRLGDSASDVVARLGQPYAIAPVFGGSGYLYRIGGNIVRYDTDKSNKVNALVQILDRK